jgi:hypothetical protein
MARSNDESQETEQPASCKIDRTAAAYDHSAEAERLGEYWTCDDERYSLRDLAAYFNHQLLRVTMKRAGLNPLERGRNTYRLPTDDDVS